MAKPFGIVTKHGKHIPQDILEQYAVKADEKTRQIPADSFHQIYGTSGVIQPLYNPLALAKLLEMNTYHYRCCRTKARETAGIGWSLKPLSDDADQESQIYKDLDEFFNDLPESITNVFDRAVFDYEAVGYGAVEVVRVDYKPEERPALFTHIPAHTIRIHRGGNKFLQMRGNKRRWFKALEYDKDVHIESGVEHELGTLEPEKRASEVMWFVNYTPRSDYYGLPDIMPAMGAIHGDISRRDYNIAFFENYGVPAYAVFVTGNFDPGEIDEHGRTEMEKAIEGHFNEMAKNPHSTLILSVPTRDREGEVKIEFKPLATEVKEASFRLYRKDNRDEVLSAHGVPPYRAGIAEEGSLGGNTAAESTEIYKQSIINPRQEMIETAINRFVVWGAFEANEWAFKFDEIDTSDEKHDLDMAKGLFEVGGITPNQIIRHFGERFGLEEVDHPMMNAHYVAGQPIDVEPPEVDEVEAVMLGLRDRLLEVAAKHASSGNGHRGGEVLDISKVLEVAGRKSSRARSKLE